MDTSTAGNRDEIDDNSLLHAVGNRERLDDDSLDLLYSNSE